MLMALMGIAVMGSYLVYQTLLVNEYIDRSDRFLEDYELASKELNDQLALDHIQTCIDAQKSNDINKAYYCEGAVAFYRDAFLDASGSTTELNIQRAAYGVMKVEMANRLRFTALQRLHLQAPSIDQKLGFMLKFGVWLICILGSLAMIFTILMTYRIASSVESLNRGKRTILLP